MALQRIFERAELDLGECFSTPVGSFDMHAAQFWQGRGRRWEVTDPETGQGEWADCSKERLWCTADGKWVLYLGRRFEYRTEAEAEAWLEEMDYGTPELRSLYVQRLPDPVPGQS